MVCKSGKDYKWDEHKHRFAMWTAATAASASPKCRFSVRHAWLGIESLGKSWHNNLDALINSRLQTEFDKRHKTLCGDIQKSFKEVTDNRSKSKVEKEFSFGVAAKFLNVYLKTILNESQMGCVHPPLDRILLQSLVKLGSDLADPFKKARKEVRNHLNINDGLSWSHFDYKAYKIWIDAIREYSPGGLWRIEKNWEPWGVKAPAKEVCTGEHR